MFKLNKAMLKEAESLFKDHSELLSMLKSGNPKSLDLVFSMIGFNVDEDDVIRAFRNKKEQKLLDAAKKAKSIRDFYQKLFFVVEEKTSAVAEKHNFADCV